MKILWIQPKYVSQIFCKFHLAFWGRFKPNIIFKKIKGKCMTHVLYFRQKNPIQPKRLINTAARRLIILYRRTKKSLIGRRKTCFLIQRLSYFWGEARRYVGFHHQDRLGFATDHPIGFIIMWVIKIQYLYVHAD